ncbi:glycosyltransferase family 2 protein [Viridibacterium curvum]|uniref:Glycosyltransferase 2-like domain-containing protein n=1 Tax=Viridibacterium curvum TaxID=1101404 RepID=A0ABP9QLD6_9RHOO
MIQAGVQIIILARDRPDFLRDALRSICTQDTRDFSVCISDNSETDAVEAMVGAEFPQFTYVRRRPALPALEHFRRVMEESSAEHVVFFHDDDVMCPTFVRTLSAALEADPGVAAVAGNAAILKNSCVTAVTTMGGVSAVRDIAGAEALARAYLEHQSSGVAAFPGYMYRRATLAGLCLDPDHGGKYADVSFLMKLAERGRLRWLPQVLMHYRIHGGNDSGRESIPQVRKLLHYVCSTTSIRRDSAIVREYRYRYWLRWWRVRRTAMNRNSPWRERVVQRYLVLGGLRFALTRPDICLRYMNRRGR